MSRLKSVALNLTLLGVALVVTILLMEGAVRLFMPQPTGISKQDPYGLTMHWPGMTRYLPQFGHDVSFNSAGLRDREHAVAKEPGVFRILLLGDSFMEALQVPFDSSTPSLLERELTRRAGRPVEVINAGTSGWGTDDELRYVEHYGLPYKPDMLLVAMTLHNDISDNLRREWHTLEGDSLVTRPVQRIGFPAYQVAEIKGFLATRFQLYQLWRRVRHGGEIRQIATQLDSHVTQLFQNPSPERIALGVKVTAAMLRQMQQVAREHGASVGIVLLPIAHQLSDTTFALFRRQARDTTVPMDLERPQLLVKAIADSLGIPVIDLLPGFRQWVTQHPDSSLYLKWDGHWNATGHRLAVDLTTPGLLTSGLVPRATP
jgi:hypothetical protein